MRLPESRALDDYDRDSSIRLSSRSFASFGEADAADAADHADRYDRGTFGDIAAHEHDGSH